MFTYQCLRSHGIEVSLCANGNWAESRKDDLSRMNWDGDLVDPGLLSVESRDFDLCLSSGFQSIVPEKFLNSNEKPKLNLHASLLPRYRGKHGGIWALIEDEKYTGISLHHLAPEVDSGPLVWQTRFRVPEWGPLSEIQRSLYSHLRFAIENLVAETILLDQRLTGIGPNHLWPVRKPQDSVIDWSQSPRALFCFVRALSRPGIYAFSFLESEVLTFDEIAPTPVTHNLSPGTVIGVTGRRSVFVAAGYGSVVEASIVGGKLGRKQMVGHTLELGRFR